MVSHLVDFGKQVAGNNDGHIEHARKISDEGANLMNARRIETVGRLVEQKQRRFAHERSSDAKALPHTERVVPDALPSERRIVKTDDFQHLVDLGLG